MDTKNIERKDGKLSFQVEVDPARFEQEINKAYLKNRKSIMIPGFRKGKAPRKLIESMYGEGIFYEDAMEGIALECFQAGLAEAGDRTVGDPAITDYQVGDDKGLTIRFEIDLYPEVTLGEYKGLSAYKPPVEVTDAQVDAELESIRKRNARIVSVEREAQNGDTVIIDFEGFLNGKAFDGGKGKDHKLKLGSGSFVPGFEDGLVGVKAGESRDLPITFPQDYVEDLAGKDVIFKVQVKEVQEEQLAELDDDFAQDVSEFDTLAEYKESIRADMTKKAEEKSLTAFRTALQAKAAEGAEVKIPAVMTDRRVDGIVEEYSRTMSMQGYTLDQYLAMMNMNEAGFRQFMRPAATEEIKGELVLEKIAEVEGIQPTEEEIEEEYKKSAERYGMELDYLKSVLKRELVVGQLTREKAGEFLVANGIATDKEEEKGEEPAAETEAKPEAEAEVTE